jgi:hypothetical protein
MKPGFAGGFAQGSEAGIAVAQKFKKPDEDPTNAAAAEKIKKIDKAKAAERVAASKEY